MGVYDIQSAEFDGCCGGIIYKNLGHCPSHEHVPSLPHEEINKWLDKNERHHRDSRGKAFAIIALTGAQDQALGGLFAKRGYLRVPTGMNPGHEGANIILHILSFKHELSEGLKEMRADNGEDFELNTAG